MPRPELPSGTVTFLFTDVEGSTRLLHEHGERYAGLLAEHRRLLREAFRAHGGVEVDTQGDAFFYAFARASDALAAAEAGQRALEATPVRVRMGVHTGEPTVTEEGYVGLDVHKAARIAAAGHGGQVLVSEATARLAGAEGLVDLGLHRLKDLSAAERLFQLGHRAFGPLTTLGATNLPVVTTPLVGRRRELAELAAAVSDGERLVTITGAGGTGKTRLALQGAAELIGRFPHGVYWVSLQGVTDAALVVPTIAQTLGAKVALTEHLRSQSVLLLLDNLEHLLAAAPDLGGLLAECPEVRLLVTSRAPLRIAGEREFPLDPLPTDEAAELFVVRARAAGRPVEADATVAAICRRLDGLPLAVELAAARARLLAPSALLARLERALPVLTGGLRDAPARQRTLRATIEWSYELLDKAARGLFARLAVFAGTFSLEAAEEVCGADLDSVASLVDLGLLRPVRDGRFLFLETIAEYASERLAATGEEEALRRRHADYFVALALSANLAADAEGPARNEVVLNDQHNIRAALRWTLAAGENELGLRIAVALENFWATTDPAEGRRWVDALLEGDGGAPRELRARALRVRGGMSNMLGDLDLAERLFEESLREFRALGDERGEAILLHRLASVAALRNDWGRVRPLAERALEGHRRTRFRKGEAQALTHVALAARAEGDLEGALAKLEESRRIATAIEFRWWLAGVSANIAAVLLELGRVSEARERAEEALATARSIRDRAGTLFGMALLSEVSARAGASDHAGVLWGALEAETERAPAGRWIFGTIEPDRVVGQADAAFEHGRARGRELSLEEAVEEALSPLD